MAKATEIFANCILLAERRSLANVSDVVGNLEVAECPGALGVDHALGDALAVKVGHRVKERHILGNEKGLNMATFYLRVGEGFVYLEENGPAGSGGHGVGQVIDGGAEGGRQGTRGLESKNLSRQLSQSFCRLTLFPSL